MTAGHFIGGVEQTLATGLDGGTVDGFSARLWGLWWCDVDRFSPNLVGVMVDRIVDGLYAVGGRAGGRAGSCLWFSLVWVKADTELSVNTTPAAAACESKPQTEFDAVENADPDEAC